METRVSPLSHSQSYAAGELHKNELIIGYESPEQREAAETFVGSGQSKSGLVRFIPNAVCLYSSPGAVCTASVLFSTGRAPVSFSGSAQTVGGSGKVG